MDFTAIYKASSGFAVQKFPLITSEVPEDSIPLQTYSTDGMAAYCIMNGINMLSGKKYFSKDGNPIDPAGNDVKALKFRNGISEPPEAAAGKKGKLKPKSSGSDDGGTSDEDDGGKLIELSKVVEIIDKDSKFENDFYRKVENALEMYENIDNCMYWALVLCGCEMHSRQSEDNIKNFFASKGLEIAPKLTLSAVRYGASILNKGEVDRMLREAMQEDDYIAYRVTASSNVSLVTQLVEFISAEHFIGYFGRKAYEAYTHAAENPMDLKAAKSIPKKVLAATKAYLDIKKFKYGDWYQGKAAMAQSDPAEIAFFEEVIKKFIEYKSATEAIKSAKLTLNPLELLSKGGDATAFAIKSYTLRSALSDELSVAVAKEQSAFALRNFAASTGTKVSSALDTSLKKAITESLTADNPVDAIKKTVRDHIDITNLLTNQAVRLDDDDAYE